MRLDDVHIMYDPVTEQAVVAKSQDEAENLAKAMAMQNIGSVYVVMTTRVSCGFAIAEPKEFPSYDVQRKVNEAEAERQARRVEALEKAAAIDGPILQAAPPEPILQPPEVQTC